MRGHPNRQQVMNRELENLHVELTALGHGRHTRNAKADALIITWTPEVFLQLTDEDPPRTKYSQGRLTIIAAVVLPLLSWSCSSELRVAIARVGVFSYLVACCYCVRRGLVLPNVGCSCERRGLALPSCLLRLRAWGAPSVFLTPFADNQAVFQWLDMESAR